MKLAQDEDGKPILPDPDGDGGMRAEAVAQVVRQFITSHYREYHSRLYISTQIFNHLRKGLLVGTKRSQRHGDPSPGRKQNMLRKNIFLKGSISKSLPNCPSRTDMPT
jgi:hypothetical protein